MFTASNVKSMITGNYIDNSYIEMTTEHDSDPDYHGGYSLGGLTISGNIFTFARASSSSRWVVIKPFGSGHFLNGLTVSNNAFKTFDREVSRIEGVDTSFAPLDLTRSQQVLMDGNTFHGVSQLTANPFTETFTIGSPQTSWTIDLSNLLAFGGEARTVSAVVPVGRIVNASNQTVFALPYIDVNQGTNRKSVRLTWPEAVKGTVRLVFRMDEPHKQ